MSSVYIENAITWANAIANDPNYNYSMSGDLRWGQHSKTYPPYYYDCSSFVTSAYSNSGLGKDFTQGYTANTSTMYKFFVANGFRDVSAAGIVQRGDVLLSHNGSRQHTCLVIGETPVSMGSKKITVQAIGRVKGIQTNYEDYSTYDYILRLNVAQPKWHAKLTGGYVDRVGNTVKFYEGAYDNIDMIYSMLYADGWTLQAIAGVIGNICAESGLNPWRWQMSTEDYHGHTKGYGLVQFTPAYTYYRSDGTKVGGYIDDYGVGEPGYSPSLSTTSLTPGATPEDGNAQMLCVMTDKAGKWYVRPSAPQQYKVSWSDYKNITDLNIAVGTWLWCYEYPADISGTIATRMIYARAIYDYISGHSPTPPIPPQPTIRKGGLPAWLIRSVNNKNTKGVFKV